MRRAGGGRLLPLGVVVALLAGCGPVGPDPTPYPTTAPSAPVAEAVAAVRAFADAWADGDVPAMHALLAPADRAIWDEEAFAGVYAGLADATRQTGLSAEVGEPRPTALPPEARPADLPPPALASPAPAASGEPAPSAAAGPSVDPSTVLDGPVSGLAVPLTVELETARFGTLRLERDVPLTHGADGWQIRWDPALIFPELVGGGTLRAERELSPRGRIVGTDGTVWAQNLDDGTRAYPQEWLAGQTIGYASEVTAEDLETLDLAGYLPGDLVGRGGLEAGAEEVLRGTPGWTLIAEREGAEPETVAATEMVPGADLAITLRPALQARAEQVLAGHGNGATAALDPRSGDVWALASAPAFNPNAMTLGTTLDGVPLAAPTTAQIINKAALGAYPAGSSFKPFTLAAALQTGVAGPGTRMPCPGTWTFSGFTFHNYEDHALPGNVALTEAMAFSCNTTYMPLSVMVYEEDPAALTELVAAFGFGEPTGIRYLPEASGILPDAAYFEEHERWDGRIVPYNEFDQIQLSIGQGSFAGTMLQLAAAYAAIGNGGTLWRPRIVTQVTAPDGEVMETHDPETARRIDMTADQLAYVTDSLEAVVNLPYGTAYSAFAGFGIPVAGKSGTAETGTPDPHALFPAFAPAADPRIAVASVLLHMPLGTGGENTAPLVRSVMAQFFAGG
ncbi:MAG TPA: penicillin-binding transpeptidase domain-containing protein [Candidatus Limnocylindria bacterium]|nr:penicillin-binding transpeptidase domain-containing protein [Candidatus Limnocylindria bacterium]